MKSATNGATSAGRPLNQDEAGPVFWQSDQNGAALAGQSPGEITVAVDCDVEAVNVALRRYQRMAVELITAKAWLSDAGIEKTTLTDGLMGLLNQRNKYKDQCDEARKELHAAMAALREASNLCFQMGAPAEVNLAGQIHFIFEERGRRQDERIGGVRAVLDGVGIYENNLVAAVAALAGQLADKEDEVKDLQVENGRLRAANIALNALVRKASG